MRIAVIGFALGVILLQMQSELPPEPAAMAVLALLLAGLGLRRMGGRAVLLLVPLWVAAGFGYAAWRAECRLADSLPAAWEGRDIEVIGDIAELPQRFAQGSRFRLRVEQVLTPAARVPEDIMLSWYSVRHDDEEPLARTVRAGERWQLTVRLKRPQGNANPHAFDYEAWLLERGIRATGYVRPHSANRRLAEMIWTPGFFIERLREGGRDRFERLLPGAENPYAGVLMALAIGDQRAINGDLWNVFNRTGTTHLMSISGLHVTMIGALVAGLAGSFWRRVPALALRLPTRRAAIVAGALAALFYALLSGFGVPAQRTVYMLAIAAVALITGRAVSATRVLCLVLLVVLLIDPWAVLAPGFWLSFGAVAALLFIGTARVGEQRGWKNSLRQWGMTQWAATLASLPVLLLVFQSFSLVSPVANALAIPVVSFIVTPLALGAAVLPWWPLAAAAHGVLSALMSALVWMAQWPVWQAPVPPLWTAAAAALGVMVLLLPRGVPGRMAGAVLLAPALFWPVDKPDEGKVWIDVLDVGQGLAVLVQTHAHVLLYDTGPLYSAESDAGQRIIVPYLRALGINRLDTLMVTHRDSDHSGGVASVRAALPIAQTLSSVPELGGDPCLAGQSWTWEGVRFTVLHPDAEGLSRSGKANHVSCVLKIEAGAQAMLLTSDIELPDERALLSRAGGDLSAAWMLMPHHGSRTSSSPAFIDRVGAREVIIPVGYRSRFGHPKADVVQRYQERGIRIWRTDRDGAIRVRLPEGSAQSWRETRRRYWFASSR